jgi:hypothetical protein
MHNICYIFGVGTIMHLGKMRLEMKLLFVGRLR